MWEEVLSSSCCGRAITRKQHPTMIYKEIKGGEGERERERGGVRDCWIKLKIRRDTVRELDDRKMEVYVREGQGNCFYIDEFERERGRER